MKIKSVELATGDPELKKETKSFATIVQQEDIIKLDPFLDQDNILKVGGRMGKCDISDDIQHPTLLPNSCKTTELIIR